MFGRCSARFVRTLMGFAVLAVSVGCVGPQLQRQFQQDYQCQETPRVKSLGDHQYEVKGCLTTAVYDCSGGPCMAAGSEDLLAEEPEVAVVREEPERKQATAERVKLSDGTTFVNLSLKLDAETILLMRAAPGKFGEVVQLSVRRVHSSKVFGTCELDWMVNGQRLEAPKVKIADEPPNSTIRANVPRSIVRELGMVQQFALKYCDDRWTLNPPQLMEIRRFVELYEEELAWKGEARAGGTGGLVAPADGWPKWEPLDESLSASTGDALNGAQLFKLLSPSVFQLEVQSKGGTSQGSAVAVTPTELLTNCHVLEGARRIIVKKGEDEFIGKITRAHPESDRCVVSVKGQALVPVKGVRAAKELAVGEPLYTLGSPNGLELSLGDGILSGLRKLDKHSFLQTTAPISPGSSGGGLFDAKGNLVGITTLVLAGRERLNQSLNFAIPADSFFAAD